MYISKPDVFGVPIRNVKEGILGIKVVRLQDFPFYSDSIESNKLRENIVIGVSFPTQREMKWIRDKENMEEYAKSKGIILKTENADTNVSLQALQVDKLISEGINILVIGPIDSATSSPMVENAKRAGLKVIAYDRMIQNADLDLFVAIDHRRIGEMQAQFLIEKVPKGNYIVMSGDLRDNNSILMKEGAMQYFNPLVAIRNIKIVVDKPVINWNPDVAYNIVKKALADNNNKIDAILAPNDATAGASIKALEEQGLAGKIPITGMDGDLDAIKRIINGTQSMTVLKNTKQQDAAVIDSAVKLVNDTAIDTNASVYNGKKYVPTIYVLPIVVTADNIEETIIKSGYFTKDQISK